MLTFALAAACGNGNGSGASVAAWCAEYDRLLDDASLEQESWEDEAQSLFANAPGPIRDEGQVVTEYLAGGARPANDTERVAFDRIDAFHESECVEEP